ncbi:NRDE family protein [Salinisphaera sp.]|uniref:NRDE family protein n=1 Tax=Salinisphaera sp. TaxID=1914330 RepID=UPI002D7727C1|nr:NRDE family protein [Salinisphaera sp.]HET7313308.1 NRDE family protein [Salinisphaera sp.]
MCLIVLAWQVDPSCPLILAANRDEFHERPTEAAHWWPAPAGLFAGRDLRSGGTWCGADTRGRVAAVTNVREPDMPTAARSRGALVADYFATDTDARRWAEHAGKVGAEYGPFNLLVADRRRLCFVSNRDSAGVRELAPGVIAVSNGHWGERWPKTERAEQRMARCVAEGARDAEPLFELLADTDPAPDTELPETGIPRAHERFLSPPFIVGAHYGTRASSVIRRHADGMIDFHERGFAHAGQPVHRIHQSWFAGST